ncbi:MULTISPECIES: BMP family protein [Terrabacteria group]|uniref:BMP family lipoprotein n=1 Tax=Bacillati TaxID=1783272 RepID=UPI001C6DF267|nr:MULTISPECIES: BMP family ABC transporter substrate-binding protein [Terrabacteria group]MBW9212009.1 BMP family ABC transporter substrate-binding protein [Trueperella sp. zg.1013]
MKKLFKVALAGLLSLSLVACGNKDSGKTTDNNKKTDMKVAMITDSGDITDQSFNQATYEAAKAWSEANGAKFTYYKPAGDNTTDRVNMIEKAVDDGYNVIVMPGYLFAGAIVDVAGKKEMEGVKFVALDVAAGDLIEAGTKKTGEKYDFKPENWDVKKYYNTKNVYSAIYHEEIPGYMAGYAAVKLGYKKLGFLGGMAVPAVVRYGYGFIQGAEAAAKELGLKDVEIKYAYSNQFKGDADITAAMDTWYKGGTQVVFSCGGGVFTSVAEAAKKAKAKIIGVDVDQKATIDGTYGEGLTVTSAMKALGTATKDTLTAIKDGKWNEIVGKIDNLGVVSADDSKNYVGLPATTQFGKGFTKEDYAKLVKDIYEKKLTISSDANTEQLPKTEVVKVTNLGSIK